MQAAMLNTGTQTIERVECLELLATEQLGRFGVVCAGEPEIFPVNYVMDCETVVFRTDLGTKLAGAIGQAVVFEVDHLDVDAVRAWSVIVHGRAVHVNDLDSALLRPRISRLSFYPSTGSDKPFVVRIAATSITGRRI